MTATAPGTRDDENTSETPGSPSVGVIGGGTMGSGIVHALLAAGLDVVLVEVSDDALRRALALVHDSLAGARTRGKITVDPEALLSRLEATTDRSALAGVGLAIEAVPELPELKAQILAEVEVVLDDDAVLASNTSSLSLAMLGQNLRRPRRLVGMHFFNPVPAQQLIEVVRTDATDVDAVERVQQVAQMLGKETVLIRDSPGFATSRLGVALGLEAVRMVEEGVASPEDIDKAMVLGYRYPMGPCRLGDLVGHDVRLGIAEYLQAQLGPRFEPPQLLRDMVAEGKLGKKSGQGFYRWDS